MKSTILFTILFTIWAIVCGYLALQFGECDCSEYCEPNFQFDNGQEAHVYPLK